MKKALGIIFVFFMFYSSIFSFDPCFPGGIVFSTQHDIDIYKEIYPDCTEILGDVVIEGNDIVDLNGIDIVTAINGNLIIRNCPNLTNTTGLLSLSTIGGNFEFVNNDTKNNLFGFGALTSIGAELIIQDNNSLSTLRGGTVMSFTFPGLANVTAIGGGILIDSNPALINLDGLEDLQTFNGDIYIEDNPALANITGLSGITGEIYSIQIHENSSLINLVGLHNISSTTERVVIWGNDLLVDLNGLDGLISVQDLSINFNEALLSLESLSNLIADAGVLSIQGNDNLQNLNGLNNLAEVGSIIIFDNQNLVEISDLWNLTSITDGSMSIRANPSLTSLQGINNINHNDITGLTIKENTLLSICDVESVCSYLDLGRPVFIEANAPGCNTEEEVDLACSPPTCPDIFRPQSGETDVDMNVLIKWFPISNADGFIISIGTTPYGTDYVDHLDVGNVITYQYPYGFPCGATIYVRILAYNDRGESMDCSYSSFTIESSYIILISELNICEGESVLLEPITNGYSISWSPPDGLDDPYSFTPYAAPESSTTYVATVSSAYNNCTAQSFVDVIVHENPGITIGQAGGLNCPNECLNELLATPYGGLPPFQYAWSTGETTAHIEDLCEGLYTVTLTDANGCSGEWEAIVNELPRILLELDEIVHVTDTTMGSISMYEFIWTNPYTLNVDDPVEWTGVDVEFYSTETDIENLSAGCYRLTTFGGEKSCSIDTVYCVEDNTTGLYEMDNSNSLLKIYPNPTSSTLFIDVLGETDLEATISLVDLSGREFKSFKMKDSNVIDVSTYEPGLYFIKVSGGGKDYYKKVIFME